MCMRTELESLKVQLLQKREILRVFFFQFVQVFSFIAIYLCVQRIVLIVQDVTKIYRNLPFSIFNYSV